MELKRARRNRAKIKVALQGPSGSGKTYSALLLASGLTLNWEEITVIDTENNSAQLYADLGNYNVIDLKPPHTPERYVEAIQLAVSANSKVLIIDSISHCWEYLVDYHSKLQGNSFANWTKVTPRQRLFLDTIMQADLHVITTLRTKQEYVINLQDGKNIPEKVGLKSIQRDGVDYEFTIVFELNINHMAKASKDRTSVFMDKPEFIISSSTGELINQWCNIEDKPTNSCSLSFAIKNCKTTDELIQLYKLNPDVASKNIDLFKNKKTQLSIANQKTNKNGTINR
jgi:hypothetical protein